jgi:hypothetical protein
MHFAATASPVSDVETAILWLKTNKQPISKKKVAKITAYTRLQIAGLLERNEHLRVFFNTQRATR